MSALSDRAMLVGQLAGHEWKLVVMPHGLSHFANGLSSTLEQAARLSAEYGARIEIDLPPVAGNLGPGHLVGSPVVYRAAGRDCWSVAVLNSPWAMGDLDCDFVGAQAEGQSERYAAKLVKQFNKNGQDAAHRRDRAKQLTERDRQARVWERETER